MCTDLCIKDKRKRENKTKRVFLDTIKNAKDRDGRKSWNACAGFTIPRPQCTSPKFIMLKLFAYIGKNVS